MAADLKVVRYAHFEDVPFDLPAGEIAVWGQGEGGRPKWAMFTCPRDARRQCMIALRPQKNGVGASWDWNGDVNAPSFTPSIACNGSAGCGWHGYITAGAFVGA